MYLQSTAEPCGGSESRCGLATLEPMRGGANLGQHFLRDEGLLARIASAAVAPDDTVIEIGPGRGALTRHLLGIAGRVVAIELDDELAEALPRRCGAPQGLTVIAADILKVSLPDILSEPLPGQTVVVGNLPYYITSPILRKVLAARDRFRSATFLMQDEVADRVVASAGSRSFGFLSCLCQLQSGPEKLFRVPPGAFEPPPAVHSAVVRFDIAGEPPPAGLLSFLSACFRHPRKMLKNNLAAHYPPRRLNADPCAGMRAQQLSLSELREMWARLEGP